MLKSIAKLLLKAELATYEDAIDTLKGVCQDHAELATMMSREITGKREESSVQVAVVQELLDEITILNRRLSHHYTELRNQYQKYGSQQDKVSALEEQLAVAVKPALTSHKVHEHAYGGYIPLRKLAKITEVTESRIRDALIRGGLVTVGRGNLKTGFRYYLTEKGKPFGRKTGNGIYWLPTVLNELEGV